MARDFIGEAIHVLLDGPAERTLGDYIGHLNGRDEGQDSYAVATLTELYQDQPLGDAIAMALSIGVIAEQLHRAAHDAAQLDDSTTPRTRALLHCKSCGHELPWHDIACRRAR